MKRLHFKSLMAFLLATVMILTLIGCGTKKDDSSTTSTASIEAATTKTMTEETAKKEVVTFSLVMFTDWYKTGWQAIESIINSKPELGFKLDIQKIAGGDQGMQIMKTKFAAGEQPDFIQWYHAKGAANELGGADNFFAIDDPAWTANFDMNTLQSKLYSINGKIVGLPIDGASLGGILYNKKVFSELGLQIPNNWSEFLDVCGKIKAAGKVPVYYSGKDAWSLQIIPIEGFSREFKTRDANQVMEEINTNKAKYADQKLFVDSIAKLKELKDKGYINKEFLSDTYDNAQKALAEGSAAMYAMGTWVLDEINKKYPDNINNIGAFAVPFDGNDIVGAWMPYCLMMTTGCKDVDLGKKVINYIGSIEVQNEFFKASPAIPVMKGLDVNLFPAAQDLYKIYTTDGRGGSIYQMLNDYEAGTFDKYCQDLLVDAKTPEQVAQAMDAETAKNAKSKGAAGW